jgi:cytochrome b6-f complex iron-sulfur subunit
MSDFPVIIEEPVLVDTESNPTRRAFLGVATAAGLCYAGAIGYPVYRYLASSAEMAASETAVTEVTLDKAQDLPVASALMFKFGSSPAMLIHGADDSWVAFSAVCTHLGCTVKFEPALNRIHCSCHGGVYDPHTGKNVSGPPPKPLKAYKVNVGAANVVVSRA